MDFFAHRGFHQRVFLGALLRQHVEHFRDQVADMTKFGNAEAARGAGRRAEPDTGGDRRFFRVERDAVLVAGDVGAPERRFRHLARQPLGPQVNQHEMGIRTAGDDIEPARFQRFRQRLGILDDILRVELEGGTQRFTEGHRLGGDDMHQGSALQTREHSRVELLGQSFVVGEDNPAARTAQRLMRGGRHHMRMRKRAGMGAAGHQAGEMRHVDHEIGANGIRDLAEAAEIRMRG